MSLDVYLVGPEKPSSCECHGCGNKHETTTREYYYSSNITHNLGRMASEAGIYEALWRPDEIGAKKASDIVDRLRVGLGQLRDYPARFEAFNAPNGWGKYEHFVPFVERYLAACEANPDATIEVSR